MFKINETEYQTYPEYLEAADALMAEIESNTPSSRWEIIKLIKENIGSIDANQSTILAEWAMSGQVLNGGGQVPSGNGLYATLGDLNSYTMSNVLNRLNEIKVKVVDGTMSEIT